MNVSPNAINQGIVNDSNVTECPKEITNFFKRLAYNFFNQVIKIILL